LIRVRLDVFYVDAAGSAGRPLEVLGDEVGVEADGLEDLGALVRFDRRDAHTGHRLQQTVLDGRDVRPDRPVGVGAVRPGDQVLDGLVGQVGIHRAGTVAHQRRDVVGRPRVARLEDEADVVAQTVTDEVVVVDAAHGEQARDGDPLRAGVPVGEDDDVVFRRGVGGLVPDGLRTAALKVGLCSRRR